MSRASRTKLQLTLPAVLLLAGVAITFTPTLHENSLANHITAALTLLALGAAALTEAAAAKSGNKPINRLSTVGSAIVAAAGAVLLMVLADGILPLWIVLACCSAAFALLLVPVVKAGSSYYLTLSAAVLCVAELVAGRDQVAAIGWLGAMCVVAGVFRAIEVADGLRIGEKAASR